MVNPMQYATQLQHMTANPGAYGMKGWHVQHDVKVVVNNGSVAPVGRAGHS
jgi:hypothetical protein